MVELFSNTLPARIPSISNRQFQQALTMPPWSQIREDEALAWGARGDLPDKIEQAISTLPEDQRFPARMVLTTATEFKRDHPLVEPMGAILGFTAADLDALWISAAAL